MKYIEHRNRSSRLERRKYDGSSKQHSFFCCLFFCSVTANSKPIHRCPVQYLLRIHEFGETICCWEDGPDFESAFCLEKDLLSYFDSLQLNGQAGFHHGNKVKDAKAQLLEKHFFMNTLVVASASVVRMGRMMKAAHKVIKREQRVNLYK
jgi:hypothetical protein